MATSRVSLITADDLISQLTDQAGGVATDGLLLRKARRGLQSGLMEVNSHRRWNYSRRSVIIKTSATYSTGTVTYTNSTKTITLASGTFPSWAGTGFILIATIPYMVKSRTSGTVLILDDDNNPGADVAALTTYTLFRKTYRLKYDVSSLSSVEDMTSHLALPGITADRFDRSMDDVYQAGAPQRFTVVGDPWMTGALALQMYPIPSDGRIVKYTYDRTQQPLRVWKYNTGTVTISAAGTALTGTGTAWTASHVGTVIRFGTATTEPTALEGASPYAEERVISSVESATTATLDEAVDNAYTAVKYVISDLIDVEPVACKQAVMACSSLHFARERNADGAEIGRRTTAYVDAIRLAMESDRRFTIADSGLGIRDSGYPMAHTPTRAGY